MLQSFERIEHPMPVDIVLVHPLFLEKDPIEKKIMTPYFPLGLMYLAAVLRREGYEVELYDCTFRKDYKEFAEYLKRRKPAICGITSLITIRRHALILAEIAKRSGSWVVLGGPDPTAIPERYLFYRTADDSFPVDAVVYDEGELTISDLARWFFTNRSRVQDLREIPWIRLRGEGDEVIATPPRELIMDLDSLPFPARDLVDMESYRRTWQKAHGYFSLTILHTRGCPYHCNWCQKAVFGRRYRSRSPENAAEEMLEIKKTLNPDHLRVVDDITGVKRPWVLEWSEAVARRGAEIPFECLTRVNLVSEDMLYALKKIRCEKIYFGAESGSQKVLDAMEKGITVHQIYRARELCRKVGIRTYFLMMVGYPGEEFEDLKLSVKLIRETIPDEFSTTIAYPLPGTKFYERVRDRLIFDSGEYVLDWDYTGENRLLFKRDRYNTTFYRWMIRWFQAEWEDARLSHDQNAPSLNRILARLRAWILRGIVTALASFSLIRGVRFQPAEGR